MFDAMALGGAVMWLILAAAAVALTVFLERAFHVHRARIKTDDFLKGIFNILGRGNITEAVAICEETPGPVACIARAAILHHDRAADEIERAMDSAAILELKRLERRLPLIATLAQISPLLGLLGTVVGLIRMFSGWQAGSPLVHSGDLAAGIWQALLTTAAGLALGALCHWGYNLLVSKIEDLTLDMERAVVELASFFARTGGAQGK